MAPQQYGATSGMDNVLRVQTMAKTRMNMVAVSVALFLPWTTFTIVFGLLSFSMRYKHPDLCWFVIGLLFLLTLICGTMAFRAYRMRQSVDPSREPTWYIFVFVALVLALLLGLIMGDSNFNANMKQYYDITNLNTYPALDPALTTGQQVMDAGRVIFTRGSFVDVSRSMGFKRNDVYCVAPIVASGNPTMSNNDFWAVGVNCCSSDAADFHCSQHVSGTAHGGLRLLDERQSTYFKLALEQARVAYGINAKHPLFFTWMDDPIATTSAHQDAGLQLFVFGVLAFFALQLFTVIMVSIGFSKLG
jgi:multisubunit Na+/H+ antiporter MnhB subunit